MISTNCQDRIALTFSDSDDASVTELLQVNVTEGALQEQ